jgi:hypothetical protein
MSELIADLDYRVVDQRGREYFVNVAAEPGVDGRWEAWLEFVPLDDAEPLLTGTETHQASRADVAHWATTLMETFIDGAFARASAAGEPGRTRRAATLVYPDVTLDTRGVLDPFALLPLRTDVLRAQLRPLTRMELLAIIAVNDLNPAQLSLARLSHAQLVTFIVTATDAHVRLGRRSPTPRRG